MTHYITYQGPKKERKLEASDGTTYKLKKGERTEVTRMALLMARGTNLYECKTVFLTETEE